MAENKEIAEALSRVYKIAKEQGGSIVRSNQINRSDRDLLVRTKWLERIMNGWYMMVKPGIQPGDSSAWYANYWDFLALYLDYRYKGDYCLSAEDSLNMHVRSTIIPKRVTVLSVGGTGATQKLPFDTSLFVYKNRIPDEIVIMNNLRIMSLPYALCKVDPKYFQTHPHEAEIALRLVQTPSDLLNVILKFKFKRPAARLIGAYHFLKDEKMAKNLEMFLEKTGVVVGSSNPFKQNEPVVNKTRLTSPYAGRILALWHEFRDAIIKIFPESHGIPEDTAAYMEQLDRIYVKDAYNSLSIEGYKVTEDLIERVRNNEWDPESELQDQTAQDALAARGYYESHLAVKESILQIFNGEIPGEVVKDDLGKWHFSLFSPMVTAEIIEKKDLFGYRKGQVFIRNSKHTPLPREALLDAMETLFQCLIDEEHPAVRAVLGHYIFVFIHPYMDGNGRLGRFLMNTMFASGGYPWTIIQMKNRKRYLDCLEIANVEQNIEPFARFVLEEMLEGVKK